MGVANCLFYENPFLINKYTPLSTVTVVSHFNIATSDRNGQIKCTQYYVILSGRTQLQVNFSAKINICFIYLPASKKPCDLGLLCITWVFSPICPKMGHLTKDYKSF